ncbi:MULTISPECIES: nucleotide-binding domain-containing protein [Pectobacterium]|uniref:nucleotide-binding domain-containing protein n=1 Tax=Pectobacterium TaxID=122277 RepID=UPI0015DF8A26|nr:MULTISPECIES: nucleotidyltransferase [Pectobacterium]MBA0205759.1 nucleotidyltransferase [Pectobacterium aroidearum]MBN3124378.1 nucleotidyltransferase [Pectobacterium brasiliense]
MSISEMFSGFLSNLAINNADTISSRYGELTTALNKKFRDTESSSANTLQVGSFGRNTGIRDISDLDMLYIMPKSKWDDYKDSKQLELLQDVKSAILKRYPKTKVRVDRLVVTVTYTNFHVEVQPVFEQEDCSYKYPDTKNGGSWKITKPRAEMTAINNLDANKNNNLRRLCKMVRAWRNKHGLAMGGLLIDTLAYNFLNSTAEYDDKSYLYYDWLSRDFFKYIHELEEQTEYSAPGSHQRVKVKKKFQRKAKKTYQLCIEAIDANGQANESDKWKRVYGRPFPKSPVVSTESLSVNNTFTWRNTEEFIEDKYPIDIKENLKIDCEVKQHGFREHFLRDMIARRLPLKNKKDLRFIIKEISVQEPFEIYWKVLNRGSIAKKRNNIRGQIVQDSGMRQKIESTDFRGDHIVECYCVKDGIVIAKDRIHVPIVIEGNRDE